DPGRRHRRLHPGVPEDEAGAAQQGKVRAAHHARPRLRRVAGWACGSAARDGSAGGACEADRHPAEPGARRWLMRVVSLIASATEIVSALGFRDALVARSHECDFPDGVQALPAVTRPKFNVHGSSADIDRAVKDLVRDGLSVYEVDSAALEAL